MKIKKLAAVMAVSVAVAGAMAVSASAETAGLMCKMNNWAYRHNLNQSNAVYEHDVDDEYVWEPIPGWEKTDVEITSNGQFMCSYKLPALEDAKDGIDAAWKVLKLDTNVNPEEYPDFTITIDHLYADGVEVPVTEGYTLYTQKPERCDDKLADADVVDFTANYYSLEFHNEWNKDSRWISPSDGYGREVYCIFTVNGFKEPEDGVLPVVDFVPEVPAPETEAPETEAVTEAPVTTEAPTTTNAPTTTPAPSNNTDNGGSSAVIWIIIGAAVVVVAVVAVVIIKKKK